MAQHTYMTLLPIILRTAAICTAYIILNASMITSNKYIMNEGRFPHPLALTALHMIVSLVLGGLFYALRPSMFPGLERVREQPSEILRWMVPSGCCFAVMLYGSNKAYLYCGIALLQFMKEGNVAIVFAISCLVGTQVMTRSRLFVLTWILLGSSSCVAGEIHPVLIGIVLQLTSQLAECLRLVIADWLLSSGSLKLDPLSYTMCVAPACLVVLGAGNVLTWSPEIVEDAMTWWLYLIPNACLAFALNLTIAVLIKETSAVGCAITGIVKDIFLVLASSYLFRDDVALTQWLSFLVTLSGISFWSLMKLAPAALPVQILEVALGMQPEVKRDDESTKLVTAIAQKA